jgi:hypothetical protein
MIAGSFPGTEMCIPHMFLLIHCRTLDEHGRDYIAAKRVYLGPPVQDTSVLGL